MVDTERFKSQLRATELAHEVIERLQKWGGKFRKLNEHQFETIRDLIVEVYVEKETVKR